MPDYDAILERLNAQDAVLLQVSSDVASVSTNVDLLRKELLGNGQPGRLSKVETKIELHQAQLDRTTGFWKGVNWIKAIIVVVAAEAIRYLAGRHH